MAIRYTVYCQSSVAGMTPEQLLAGMDEADLHTIAEDTVSDDDVIAAALDALRMQNLRPPGFEFYRLCYREDGKGQIDIERWQSTEQVRGVVAEVIENLDEQHPALNRIREHLERTVDIVDASFGSSPGEAMAPVLASEVTRWLAEHYGGIIRADDDTWWTLGRHGEYQPLK